MSFFDFLPWRTEKGEYEYVAPNQIEMKQKLKVLFIDDEKFPVIELLRRDGWNGVSHVEDIASFDESALVEAHVLFVDIQGVGKVLGFSNEGLGLIKAVRDRFERKYIVAYSGESEGKLEAFSEEFNFADFVLSKTADPYQFTQILYDFSSGYFTDDKFISSIHSYLNTAGKSISRKEIRRLLFKANSQDKLTDASKLRELFSLSNASNLVSIVSAFVG